MKLPMFARAAMRSILPRWVGSGARRCFPTAPAGTGSQLRVESCSYATIQPVPVRARSRISARCTAAFSAVQAPRDDASAFLLFLAPQLTYSTMASRGQLPAGGYALKIIRRQQFLEQTVERWA